MELFFEAEKNYKEKKFQAAYRYYRQCLENHKTNKKTMLLCCQKILRLSDSLNIGEKNDTEELLSRSFFHLARYDSAARHGETAIKKRKSCDIYEILWESHFRQGNLLKAEKIAEDYLVYCKNKHLCDSGLNFIKKLEKISLHREQFSVLGMELEIIRGNKEFVVEKLEELDRLFDENASEEILRNIRHYQDCIHLYKKYWEQEKIVRKVFLKYWRENFNSGRILTNDAVERKKIIHFILIDFLLGGDHFGETLEVYARIFERNELLASLHQYKNKKCSRKNEINDVEKDAELFLDKDVQSENTKSVLGKIRSYGLHPEQQKERKFDIFLDGLSDEFLIKNAENLLIAMMDMELHERALKFFDEMREKMKKESVEYQINMAYMEILALAKSGRSYQALDHIDDTLSLLPVKKKEKKMFIEEKKRLMKKISLYKENI